jgi:putative transcriptional regulator
MRVRALTPLYWARVWAGLTQEELAASVGATRETISSIERGRSIPSVALAIRIAHRLEQPVDSLFDVDRSEPARDDVVLALRTARSTRR